MVQRATSRIALGMVALGVFALSAGAIDISLNAQEANYDNVSSDIVFSIRRTNFDGHTPPPFLVEGLEIEGKQVPLDRPVHVTGHWLAHLTLTARNVSVKDMVESQLTLVFPESGTGSHERPFFSTGTGMGVRPEAALYRHDGTKAPRGSWEAGQVPIVILPGEMMVFAMDEDKYNTQEQVYKQSGGQITKVLIDITRVWFKDDTRWSEDLYLVPVSGKPGQWSKVSADQFVLKP